MWSFAHRALARLAPVVAGAARVRRAGRRPAVAAELKRPRRRPSRRVPSSGAPPRSSHRGERREGAGGARRRPAAADGLHEGHRPLAGELLSRQEELVQVQIDDRSGAILEQWTGAQVAWTMARGYEGAFGRKFERAVRVDPAVRCCSCCPFVDSQPPVPPAAPRPAGAARVRRLARLLQPRRHRALGAARLSGAALSARPHAVRRASAAGAGRARSCRISPLVVRSWPGVVFLRRSGSR